MERQEEGNSRAIATIELVQNGYVVTFDDMTTVHGGNEVSLTDALAEAFCRLKEDLEVTTSRYSDKRIYIVVQPGDKNEDYDEGFDKYWG